MSFESAAWLPLSDVVEEIIDRRGVTPLKLGGNFESEGHRVISAKLLKDRTVQLDADEARFVNGEIYKKWMKLPLQAGDVIMTSEAPLGELAYLNEDKDWVLGQRLFAIRPRKNLMSGRFLYYVLQTSAVRSDIQSRATGTTVQGIRQAELRLVKVPVPSLADQNEAASFLGALDDRITLLRETNKTLEAIAQAIFKSWFIDFDPVRAKMEGRAPAGLDQETAALFPDELVESELGLVPKGWEAGCIGDLVTLNPESWTARNKPDWLVYVDLSNAKDNVIAEAVRHPFSEAPSRARRVLRHGDTIIGTVRPGNRSFAFISNPEENLTGSTGFAVLRPLHSCNSEYVYLAATRDESIDRLAHLADGGAYPAVRPELVLQQPCVIPNERVLEYFHSVVESLIIKISFNQQIEQTLGELRETLLPRLISGKLRIVDDELVTQT